MLTPEKINIGDKVMIVAPARRVSKSDISAGIQILEQWGLDVVLSENLLGEDNQYSSVDKLRARDLQEAIDNPDIKAIFCARGGYGSVRIVDDIDLSPLLTSPKWLVGFSDVTVLHSAFTKFGIKSLHAPVVATLAYSSNSAVKMLHDVLFDNVSCKISSVLDYGMVNNRVGHASGVVVGGNLSILYSLIGSNCDVDTTDRILFIEDVDEYLYHIDRMMVSLKRAGKLSHLKGLMVGSFSQIHDNAIPFGKDVQEIILDAVSDFSYPVCFNMPFGHTNCNMPLIFLNNIELCVENHSATCSW